MLYIAMRFKCLSFIACIFTLILMSGCFSPSSTKVYRIARDQNWYPLNMEGKEAAVFAFSDDLLNEIANEENLHIELVKGSWDSLLFSLNQGRVEGILSSLLPILQYPELYSFSKPYILVGPVFVVRADSAIDSLDDITGLEVGVLEGSPVGLLADSNNHSIIKSYPSFTTALDALSKKNIDVVIMPVLTAEAYVRDLYKGVLKISTPPLTDEGIRLVTLKDKYPSLIEKFNAGLDKLRDDGTYLKLLQKWHLK